MNWPALGAIATAVSAAVALYLAYRAWQESRKNGGSRSGVKGGQSDGASTQTPTTPDEPPTLQPPETPEPPEPGVEWVKVANRRVKIHTGGASQSVNVCTEANRAGVYEWKVSFDWPNFVKPGDLDSQRFASLEQFRAFLVDERQGTPKSVDR
jgi:hypothetical protein